MYDMHSLYTGKINFVFYSDDLSHDLLTKNFDTREFCLSKDHSVNSQ